VNLVNPTEIQEKQCLCVFYNPVLSHGGFQVATRL